MSNVYEELSEIFPEEISAEGVKEETVYLSDDELEAMMPWNTDPGEEEEGMVVEAPLVQESAAPVSEEEEGDARVQEALQQLKAQQAVQAISEEIPNWGPRAYSDLMQYGVEQVGMDVGYVKEITDPGIFVALHKAKQYDEMVSNRIKQFAQQPAQQQQQQPVSNKVRITRTKNQATKAFNNNPSDSQASYNYLKAHGLLR